MRTSEIFIAKILSLKILRKLCCVHCPYGQGVVAARTFCRQQEGGQFLRFYLDVFHGRPLTLHQNLSLQKR